MSFNTKTACLGANTYSKTLSFIQQFKRAWIRIFVEFGALKSLIHYWLDYLLLSVTLRHTPATS